MYKTFLEIYKSVGGVIRVVLVREPDRWVVYFATDPGLSASRGRSHEVHRSGKAQKEDHVREQWIMD
jgi:hypothetical protein